MRRSIILLLALALTGIHSNAMAAASVPRTATTDAAALKLRSSSIVVLDQPSGNILVERNPNTVTPIASITKLMTAMVVLDAQLPLDQSITIENADIDRLKGTHSRLPMGSRLTRNELLRLALMSSENRAAAALVRTYPGGRSAFITAMNDKAKALAMSHTRFVDSAGLSKDNVSTANDLVKMVTAAGEYRLIREFTTTVNHSVGVQGQRAALDFRNTNGLIRGQSKDWHIVLSKTGYTAEAGRCLVMQAKIGTHPIIIVLLDSWGRLSPLGDANRIRRWMESRNRRAG